MTKLDELIQEYCPDGVEFRKLVEISQYCKERIDASTVDKTCYVGVENLLQNKQGKTLSSAVPTTRQVIAFSFGDILIGNIRPYLKKIWLADCNGGTNGDVLAIHITDSGMLPEFLYYVLSSDSFFHYDMQYAKGSKMPRGSKEAVLQYITPVPPLPVQREIVRILDNFTELTEGLNRELAAELTARKKQYAYYRDKLLTFGDVRVEVTSDVIRRTLGEVCKISAGGDAPKDSMSKQKTEKYSVPIISNGIGENALYGYTDAPKVEEPAVTVAARGTIGYAEYRDYPFYPIIRLLTAIPKDSTVVNTKYLYYCLQGKQYSVPMGGIPQLTAPELKKVEIPIPSLDVQNRIVQVLDNFDAICTDLSSGLTAEIEARQKQYEYYRDKLLTFTPADCPGRR